MSPNDRKLSSINRKYLVEIISVIILSTCASYLIFQRVHKWKNTEDPELDMDAIRAFRQRGQEPSRNTRTDYHILILTPFSDSVDRLTTYLTLLHTLTYPSEKISIAFGQDAGFKTKDEANKTASKFQKLFHDIQFYSLEQSENAVDHITRHIIKMQPVRRHHMAISRNELLFRALRDEHDWVIWIDVDMQYIPPNLIQLLLSPNQPIVSPVCAFNIPFLTYDRNNWQETSISRTHIKKQKEIHGSSFVMIEEYMDPESLRKRLAGIRDKGTVVQLDGIGGCALLVNASCHRQGLTFPTFSFDSHIETEGLAKMATKMGIPIYGLPFVQVFHDMKNMYIDISGVGSNKTG